MTRTYTYSALLITLTKLILELALAPKSLHILPRTGTSLETGVPLLTRLHFTTYMDSTSLIQYYVQRPEVLESNFYAWRVTGNQTYLHRARSAAASFIKYLSTPTGFAGIYDVNNPATLKINETESFWFAEVLKYL